MDIKNKGDTETMTYADLMKELIEENKRLTLLIFELIKEVQELKKAVTAATDNGKD